MGNLDPRRLLTGLTLLVSLSACGNTSLQNTEKQKENSYAALLSTSCTGCHDYAPNSMGPSNDFFKTLKTIQDDDTQSAMYRMIIGYSDEELRLIADYFGTGE